MAAPFPITPAWKKIKTSPTRQRGECLGLPSLARRASLREDAGLPCRGNILWGVAGVERSEPPVASAVGSGGSLRSTPITLPTEENGGIIVGLFPR